VKTLLSFSITIIACIETWAANPSFQSFFTNDFIVVQPLIYAKHTNTGGTNVFIDTLIINTNTTNFFDNSVIIITNTYITIDGTNVATLGDVLWTNFGPYMSPVPFTNSFFITTNGSVLSGNTVWPFWFPDADDAFISVSDIVSGETGVRKLYLAGVDDTGFPINYSSARIQVAGGAQPSGQFNLASTLNGNTSRFTVNLQPDAGVANIQFYNNGVLNFGVNDASGYSGTGTNFLSDDGTYKQGVGTTINPTDQFIPYRFDGATFADSPLYRIDPLTIGVDTIDANVIAATNLQSGGVVYSRSDGILTNTVNAEGFLHSADASGTNLSWQAAGDICLWTNKSGLLQPVDLTLPLFWTNRVVIGPGTTSVLQLVENTLSFTNQAARFAVIGNNGGGYIGAGTGSFDVSSLTNDISIGNSTRSFHMIGPNILPNFTDMTLGASGLPWESVWSKGEIIYGFLSGGDYSRLAISHGGTNGTIVFDSQSAGSAGSPRPFEFYIGGTNGFRIANDIGSWPSNAAQYFDGTGHWSVPAGGGITLNSTDGAIPYRLNSTTLADSPWRRLSDTRLGWGGTLNYFTSGSNDSIGIGTRVFDASENQTESVAVGGRAMGDSPGTADYNVAIGASAGRYLSGIDSIIIGRKAMAAIAGMTNSYNTIIGAEIGQNPTDITSNSATNSISLGYAALNLGSNTATVGNTNVSVMWLGGEVAWAKGNGDPEGVLALPVGSFYSRKDGGAASAFYVKETGASTVNGWVAK
jgi:hypothetical protein